MKFHDQLLHHANGGTFTRTQQILSLLKTVNQFCTWEAEGSMSKFFNFVIFTYHEGLRGIRWYVQRNNSGERVVKDWNIRLQFSWSILVDISPYSPEIWNFRISKSVRYKIEKFWFATFCFSGTDLMCKFHLALSSEILFTFAWNFFCMNRVNIKE
jgi:hypothetical protein